MYIFIFQLARAQIISYNQIEDALKAKGCSDFAVLLFLTPYMDESIQCITNPSPSLPDLTLDTFQINGENIGNAIKTLLQTVLDALKICTNTGISTANCTQTVRILLKRKLNKSIKLNSNERMTWK